MLTKYLKHRSLPHMRATIYAATLIHHVCCLVHLAVHDFETGCELKILYTSFQYGGRYLTIWNFIVQMIHAGLALHCELDLIRSVKSDVSKYFKLKETLFQSIMFPCSVFVCIIFWYLFLQDKTLLMDECIHLPPTVNHGLHTWIIPVVIIELLVRPRKRPNSHAFNCTLLVGFMVAYYIAVLHAHWESGIWVYPVLHRWKNSLYYIMGSGFVVSIVSYFAQWKLIDLLWH